MEDKPFAQITHTDRSIVVHEPTSTEIIETIWYAIGARNNLDPDTYEVSAYLTGWWINHDEREHDLFYKRHGGIMLVRYPEPIWNFEDGWVGTEHAWVKPIASTKHPLYQPHMRWAIEFCRKETWPAYQAMPYFPTVNDTRSMALPGFLDELANRRGSHQ